MVLAGTLIVGGCGQKAADSTAATAQVTETSDSAPADKPDGAPGENSDKPGNPLDGAQGSLDGKQAPPDGGNGGPGGPGGQNAAPTSYTAAASSTFGSRNLFAFKNMPISDFPRYGCTRSRYSMSVRAFVNPATS